MEDFHTEQQTFQSVFTADVRPALYSAPRAKTPDAARCVVWHAHMGTGLSLSSICAACSQLALAVGQLTEKKQQKKRERGGDGKSKQRMKSAFVFQLLFYIFISMSRLFSLFSYSIYIYIYS